MSSNHVGARSHADQSEEPLQQDGSSRNQQNLKAREYAKLKELLPHLHTRTDLTETDIVEEAVQHIEELSSRVWMTYSTPTDAARAKEFLLQRLTDDLKVRQQNSRKKEEPSSSCQVRPQDSETVTTATDFPEDDLNTREVTQAMQPKDRLTNSKDVLTHRPEEKRSNISGQTEDKDTSRIVNFHDQPTEDMESKSLLGNQAPD